MAFSEDDSRDTKRRMTFGEKIRMWAGTAAKVAVVVVSAFAGLNYMIKAEIEPVRKQISNLEARVGKLEDKVDRLGDKMDSKFDQLDDKFEKLGEDLAAFRLEMLAWMARYEASRLTNSSQSYGGEEGSADTSSLQPDGSAPTVPISSLPESREPISD